ncbi:MAG: hypothetical protein LBG83_09355 [Oscillospiraceae bacterium]|jgi:hypothetical protein|nr:hypothetical protein [Oscillospiraceae bacterium]
MDYHHSGSYRNIPANPGGAPPNAPPRAMPQYYDYTKKSRRPRRLPVVGWAVCAAALISFAVFSLAPSTAWFGRKVIDKPYDDGGYTYTGTLHAGKFSGGGKVSFSDGSHYEGDFLDGSFQGQGKFTGTDGWSYEGLFENGRPTTGILYTKQGELNVDFSRGEIALHNAEALKLWKYSGGLSARGQRGSGVFTFPDGAKYAGEFANGFAEGQGTYTDGDGKALYTGGWATGLYSGEGKYAAPDGSFRYEGQFANGQFNGEGTVTTKEGKTIAGTWKNGKRVKKA